MPVLDRMMFLYSAPPPEPNAEPVATVRTVARSRSTGTTLVQVVSTFCGCHVRTAPGGTAWVPNDCLSNF